MARTFVIPGLEDVLQQWSEREGWQQVSRMGQRLVSAEDAEFPPAWEAAKHSLAIAGQAVGVGKCQSQEMSSQVLPGAKAMERSARSAAPA